MYQLKKQGAFTEDMPSVKQIMEREFKDDNAPKSLAELRAAPLPAPLEELFF